MACPSCKGEDWKLASLVHNEGKSQTTSKTTGAAVGRVGGSWAVGVGGAETKGTQQSELSKLATPPSGMVLTALLIIAAVACWFFGNGFWAWTLFLLAIALAVFVEGPVLAKAQARYKVLRMCTRCGAFFTPDEETSATAALVQTE